MKNITLIISLGLAVVLALAACSTGNPPQEPTSETEIAAQEAIPATAIPVPSQSTESSSTTQGTTTTTIDFGIPVQPYIPENIKPPLFIDTGGPALQSEGQLTTASQVIGFSFPDGTIAVKAAPFVKTDSSAPQGGLTPVGHVEIGQGGSTDPGIYQVNLDLKSTEKCAAGVLQPLADESGDPLPVKFVRIPQILNPQRLATPENKYFPIDGQGIEPENSTAIWADGVCFVVKAEVPYNDPVLGTIQYFRYCSVPDSGLSPKANFSAQYEALKKEISSTAYRFDLTDDIQTDQVISEMEDLSHLQSCAYLEQSAGAQGAPQGACGSDIIVAPVNENYLMAQYNPAIDLYTFESLIPSPVQAEDVCGGEIEPAPAPTPTPKNCKSPYTVRYNEWVWKIGRRCNISPYAIIDANGLLPPYWLYPGDVLILPRNAPPFPGRPQGNLSTSQLAFALGGTLFSNAMASPAWQDESTTTPISVTVAVVKVLNQIDTYPSGGYESSMDIILPGDYKIDYWFDANGEFYAATISGFRFDGVEVINQQVPAVPATFVNADGSEQVSAQISTCRIFGWCVFFQRNCP